MFLGVGYLSSFFHGWESIKMGVLTMGGVLVGGWMGGEGR